MYYIPHAIEAHYKGLRITCSICLGRDKNTHTHRQVDVIRMKAETFHLFTCHLPQRVMPHTISWSC